MSRTYGGPSTFDPQFDPAKRNWAFLFPPPSQPSQPSRPSRFDFIGEADLVKYMFPADPNDGSYPVIGVYTSGTSTKNAKKLPAIYDLAGLELRCHSCHEPIQEIYQNIGGVPTPTGLYSLIGDHQPPTVLYRLLCDPAQMAQGIFGKLGHAAFRIQEKGKNCILYEFNRDGVLYQTNSQALAQQLSNSPSAPPAAVTYGSLQSSQFLYPHCDRCSNAQGSLLR